MPKYLILYRSHLTAGEQKVRIAGAKGALYGSTLDEDSFVGATIDPRSFQKSWKPMRDALTLKPYAVAILSIND